MSAVGGKSMQSGDTNDMLAVHVFLYSVAAVLTIFRPWKCSSIIRLSIMSRWEDTNKTTPTPVLGLECCGSVLLDKVLQQPVPDFYILGVSISFPVQFTLKHKKL